MCGRFFSSAQPRCRQRLPVSEAERSALPGLSSRLSPSPLLLALHPLTTAPVGPMKAERKEEGEKDQRQTKALPSHMQK